MAAAAGVTVPVPVPVVPVAVIAALLEQMVVVPPEVGVVPVALVGPAAPVTPARTARGEGRMPEVTGEPQGPVGRVIPPVA